MSKQFNAWDFDAMRRFVIIKTYRHKTAAAHTFDQLRYNEEYEEIYEWIERLGGEVIS